MKKSTLIIASLLFICLILKGSLFRAFIHYQKIGERPLIIITNQKLLHKIETRTGNKNLNIDEIITLANKITTQELSYTFQEVSKNPNQLIHTKKANCIGYSAMFNAVVIYLIDQNGLTNKIKARHLVGKIELLGLDMHQFFDSPFFKDHDFNQIYEVETGKSIYIDPNVYDYLGIRRISVKN